MSVRGNHTRHYRGTETACQQEQIFSFPARVSRLARFVLGIRPIVGGLGPAERAIGQYFQPRPIGCHFLLAIAPHDRRGVYRAKSRNVSETRARMRTRSRSRRLPPPAPGFQLSSRGDSVPDQAATRSASRAAEYPPPCGRSEPGSRAKHALRPQARPASRDARELSTWR
jgi:hypothetical protein